jgi:hypothetical protein
MEENLKTEFDALKRRHEALTKSHGVLLEILNKLSSELVSFVDTERGAKRYGEEIVSKRMKVHYENFTAVGQRISKLKNGA